MNYEGLIERNVNHMMEKMFGNKDSALKSITKMNLLFDGEEDTINQMENVLTKMKKMNYHESKCIEEELQLTYDKDGNIIFINNINDESENIVCEESKSQSNTDFSPSNR